MLGWLAVKVLVSAALIVAVSEIAKLSPRWGGLVAALPLITVLSLVWMRVEGQPPARIADHARYTLWYVLPTLPMFWAFGPLQSRFGFWAALGGSALLTCGCFAVFALGMRRLGVELW